MLQIVIRWPVTWVMVNVFGDRLLEQSLLLYILVTSQPSGTSFTLQIVMLFGAAKAVVPLPVTGATPKAEPEQ